MSVAFTQPRTDHPAPYENACDTAHCRDAAPVHALVEGSVERWQSEAAEDAFGWLVTCPAQLSLRGVDRPSLLRRGVRLHHVRTQLAARRVRTRDRDAIWAALIFRARISPSPGAWARWTLGDVGVALPRMVPMSARLSVRYPGDPASIEAAILSACRAELRTISTRTWTSEGLRSCFLAHAQDRGQDRVL